ncbi:simple sugar transport system permease protein [Rhodoferax ferrireducens]|uniref:Simple sugar transport system permease protein n=1 Tax=Rhodoferax ferrireducens TaxID=192843 RepID=A0ABU2CAU0_9BURK|nr:ABC transporter permease [Rhodoferax ferrireducens]MDR7378462.1 simple sugar transport system permease protein [Rhodoferax ferrireducens]
MSTPQPLPRWADVVLLPAVNLLIALLVAGLVVSLVGQNPREVMSVLLHGAFGTQRGLSYTLYYATTFIFTGLAVSVAFHGGLFNIGGEGQALMGGLGTALVALWLSHSLPALLLLPLMLLAGVVFGAAWATVPGYLQAYRNSHVVITTIMFNFLASSLLAYLLVNRLKPPGTMAVESAAFGPAAKLTSMQDALAWLGLDWPSSPLNISLFLALAAAFGVYLLLWHSRAGYRLRAMGSSESAAAYAGIHPKRQVIFAMALSGGLSGMVGMNEIAGVNGKLLLDFAAGAGFTGIAVALMGRNHPFGIVLASVLFGALFQGGAEVSFEVRGFSRDMVVMLQGFIVLFSGAMAYVIAPWLARCLALLARKPVVPVGAHRG